MKGISERSLKALPSIDHWEPDILTMYTGSDRKEGMISPDGERYLIKYPGGHARINDMDTSYVNNILSEYISSHVLQIAGFLYTRPLSDSGTVSSSSPVRTSWTNRKS